jgi:hypothetical protein
VADRRDGGAEADGGVVAGRFPQHGLQVAAEHRQGAGAQGGLGDGSRHGELRAAVGAHQHGGEEAQRPAGQRGQQAEPLGGVIARAEQIDHVTTAPPRRGTLDHGRAPSVATETEGRGQTGDAGADDHRMLHRCSSSLV